MHISDSSDAGNVMGGQAAGKAVGWLALRQRRCSVVVAVVVVVMCEAALDEDK